MTERTCTCNKQDAGRIHSFPAVKAAEGDGKERIYVVEPTGEFEDDPNLTDQKFPGNPTKSYRSKQPLKVVAKVILWEGHSPATLNTMTENLRKLSKMGIRAIV